MNCGSEYIISRYLGSTWCQREDGHDGYHRSVVYGDMDRREYVWEA